MNDGLDSFIENEKKKIIKINNDYDKEEEKVIIKENEIKNIESLDNKLNENKNNNSLKKIEFSENEIKNINDIFKETHIYKAINNRIKKIENNTNNLNNKENEGNENITEIECLKDLENKINEKIEILNNLEKEINNRYENLEKESEKLDKKKSELENVKDFYKNFVESKIEILQSKYEKGGFKNNKKWLLALNLFYVFIVMIILLKN